MTNPKLGYIGIWKSHQCEVYADSLWQAKQAVIAKLKVPKKQHHMVSVMLAEKDGQPVIHTPTF